MRSCMQSTECLHGVQCGYRAFSPGPETRVTLAASELDHGGSRTRHQPPLLSSSSLIKRKLIGATNRVMSRKNAKPSTARRRATVSLSLSPHPAPPVLVTAPAGRACASRPYGVKKARRVDVKLPRGIMEMERSCVLCVCGWRMAISRPERGNPVHRCGILEKTRDHWGWG